MKGQAKVKLSLRKGLMNHREQAIMVLSYR
jgi:hypothetical protein